MVEKYKLGHIGAQQAHRGLMAFRARCKDPRFREAARRWVEKAEGYQDTTSQVVEKAIQHCQSSKQATTPPNAAQLVAAQSNTPRSNTRWSNAAQSISGKDLRGAPPQPTKRGEDKGAV